MAVLAKQGFQQAVVGPGQRLFELREPVVGRNRNILGLVEHERFSSLAVCAAFSLSLSLYPFGTAQKGREEISVIPWRVIENAMRATEYAPGAAARGR